VNLSIPLAALPPIAGGKLSWTVGAHYNSKIWDVLRIQQEPLGTVWLPYVVDAPSASGGWTIAGQYSIVFRNANDDFDRVIYSTASGLTQGEVDLLNDHQWLTATAASRKSKHGASPPAPPPIFVGSSRIISAAPAWCWTKPAPSPT
jgi:hypothetical protein